VAGKLVWSPESVEDLEAIFAYIARDSAQYAKSVASKIVSTVESIPEQPNMGRAVPELGDPRVRERFVHRYRLIYRMEETRILVVALIHGSRSFPDSVRGFGDASST
jgi:plasmid stabilization system protein ParE